MRRYVTMCDAVQMICQEIKALRNLIWIAISILIPAVDELTH